MPVSVGTGFLALDMLLLGKDRVKANALYAGGSCGNVLSILAHLEWESYPVARLGTDRMAEDVLSDLERSGVRTDFVLRSDTGATPVVVVRIAERRDGTVGPRFEWKHPASGDWLPSYRPFPKTMAQEMVHGLPEASVFYFDRAEPSALVMAEGLRDQGAVVFFEPSSCKDDDLFTECLAVSDIVKYSADRIPQVPRSPASRSPRLEIQTLGRRGLRYRLKSGDTNPGSWRELAAFTVQNAIDATGCGDWCSAGIIHHLCQAGRMHFLKLDEAAIVAALNYGQALAAINCRYHGARGPMYELSRRELDVQVKAVLSQKIYYSQIRA
ncbi:PfkB domain protein [Opitutus terrae PB90-1]|uniref:PfkB domain protein n=2 Tax=Opitutus terrae TaxID=107709 RepID=B1ZSI0_OPITP|nr:PfkB domain protein [Opitutus terrae PB90-1]